MLYRLAKVGISYQLRATSCQLRATRPILISTYQSLLTFDDSRFSTHNSQLTTHNLIVNLFPMGGPTMPLFNRQSLEALGLFAGLSLIMRFLSFFPSVIDHDESTYILIG